MTVIRGRFSKVTRVSGPAETTATSAPAAFRALAIGFLVFLASSAGTANAAISQQAGWTSQYASSTYPAGAVNGAYAIAAGSGRVLVVAIASTRTAAGAQAVTVTYGGQALSLAAGDGGSAVTWNHSYLYYLNDAGISAAVGSSLNVTITGGTSYYTWVYAAVYAEVNQATSFTDAENYTSATANNTVGPFNPTLTINANDQAIEVVNLARSTTGTTARTITTWAAGWTTAGVSPASIATNGPTATMYIRDRNVLTAANDGSQHTANNNGTWDSMTAGSLNASISTTVGNGTNPSNAALCPGGAATMLDAFTLQTSSGTDTVTGVTVSLAAGTAAGLSLVEITNDAGTTVYGSAANPGSDTVAVTLTTNIPVTTTATQYKVRVTPRAHANMPLPQGATYTVTGTVTAVVDSSVSVYNDSTSATVTIDNLSPDNPNGVTGTPCVGQVTLNWFNPIDADFSQVVILRRTGAAVADIPVEGTTYVAGNIIGASSVVYVGSLATFINTGLANGSAYYYRIFSRDSCGNYSTGAAAGPFTPSATTADVRVTKTASAPSILPGDNVTFTITVTNNGPSTATGVTVTDPIPTDLTYVSATPSTGSCSYTAPTVTCSLGSLTNGASATISLVATGAAVGLPVNVATVAANEVDCVPANNSAGVRVTVQARIANLSITKSGSPASVGVTGTVTWTLNVTNGGPDPAAGVTVSDPIPAGMTLTSATTTWPGGSCTGNPLVTCSLGTMNSGATATITIVAVNDGPGTKSNTASVASSSATDFDSDTTNNSATATTTVTGAAAPPCANPGQQGAGGTLSGVVNTYYPGTADVNAGVANTCIPVGTPTGSAAAIATGNLLLVIQMQDADINATNTTAYGGNNGTGAGATAVNAGKYEFVVARGAVGAAGCAANTVGITGNGTNSGLLNKYTNADATTTKGQMRYQVVRVPQYTTATANGITALPWSTLTTATNQYGTGGILAIDVAGALTLNSGVALSADGAGFRGGAGRQLTGGAGANADWRTVSTVTTNGSKGEGIAGTPEWVQAAAPLQTNQPNDGYPNGSMARGAPANAGGGSTDGNPADNDQNSGGGGGSNGGAGGKGGYSWNSQLDTGGTGASVTPAVTKLVLGGGGGGGTRNNNPGANLASGGAAGGGLLVIRAAQLSIATTATISANGADAYDDTENDGGGGGGAGGSVIVTVTSGDMAGLTIQARGGKGGSAWRLSGPGANQPPLNLGINAHGPGGGGGGGVIVYSSTAVPPALDVAGGPNGTTTTALYPFGAQPGGTGQVLLAGPGIIPGVGSGSDCAPDPGVQLTHTQTTVQSGGTVTLFANVKNYSPFTATSGPITVIVTLDATGPGLTPTAASGTGWSCSISGQQVTCFRTASDALAPQLSYPAISITAAVGSGAGPATLNNAATLTPTPDKDYNLSNNSSSDPIGVAAPTLARIRSFKATRNGDVVELTWKSSFEIDNLGFVVHRESAGARRAITPSVIAGSALSVGPARPLQSGRAYAWVDDDAGPSDDLRYWLEDIALDGTRRWTGPVVPDPSTSLPLARPVAGLSPTLDAMGRAAATGEGAATPAGHGVVRAVAPPPIAQPLSASTYVASRPAAKVLVTGEGWYRVTKGDLLAAGFDPGLDPRALQLRAERMEQAIVVRDGGDGRFDDADSIEFYGLGLDSPWTGERVYWLLAGAQPGLRAGSPAPGGSLPQGPSSFPFTVERKDHVVFFGALTATGSTDNFFGPPVTATPLDQTLTVSHLDTGATGSTPVTVSLQGVTLETHVVDVRVNGHDAGTLTFAGQNVGTATFQVPVTWLVEGTNVVTLTARGGATDTSVVASVRLVYPHLFLLDQGALHLTARGNMRVTLGGLADTTLRVVDVSVPAAPRELPVAFTAVAGGYTGSVSVYGADATLYAFEAGRVLAPAGIVRNVPSDLEYKKTKADLVVIAHPSLLAAVEPLRALRQGQGLTTVVADVTDVYDEFSFGEKSPEAIRAFLGVARDKWARAPRYVLLVGDASFDPKNYLGFGDFDLVPTRMVPTAYMLTDSDDWFVDFDGDALPEMAIGRLPVRTAAEAATVVSKIVSHDQPGTAGAWSSKVLLVSDATDEFDFEAASGQLTPLVPADLTVQPVSVDDLGSAGAHSAIVSAVNGGQLLVNYMGHGSEDVWSQSDIFNGVDAAGLTNGTKLPTFVLMTCLNGLFDDLWVESIAESLLKAPGGGAVAVWASSTLTNPEPQAVMNQELFRILQDPAARIGDAVRNAKAAVTDLDVRRTWVLFGDPAMRVRPAP